MTNIELTPKEELTEKKLDYESMSDQDICDQYPELNIKDVSGKRDGTTLVFLSQKLNSDSNQNQKPETNLERFRRIQKENSWDKPNNDPVTLDELM